MPARTGLFIVMLLLGSKISFDRPTWLIVWNVGQGQWATVTDDSGCWHFDMGGEFAPWPDIMLECRDRRNFVTLSHWDMDHVVFTSKARFYLPDICLMHAPQGAASPRKLKLIEGMQACGNRDPFLIWNGSLAGSTNASSRVVYWRRVLLPGDSTRDQEKIWSSVLPSDEAKVLVLGHHGSATSTGKELLSHIHARFAIASARFRRYGHPHSRVVRDLWEKKIPLLRTEDWGTIRIPL